MKKNKIKEHEQKYWHIPKFGILPLIWTSLFGILAYLNLKLIDFETVKFVFNCVEEECSTIPTSALMNIYPIIGEYILISLTIISICAFLKGGYGRLKNYGGDGLIYGLIDGLIDGLIIGLIIGLIFGLILGLIGRLIGGLIIGLIFGLIYGLILGLIGRLIGEFQ